MKKTKAKRAAAPQARPRREKLTDAQRRRIYCVKNGHSRLREYCFGYHHCARCGEQLGDSLGGAYSDDTAVYISHMHSFVHAPKEFPLLRGCHCPDNAKKLTGKDLALTPQWNASGQEMRPPWRDKRAPAAPLSRGREGKGR